MTALFTFGELFDIVAMSLIIGFIFSDFFSDYYHKFKGYAERFPTYGFDWSSFWFATLLVAPTIILHEFGHKFVALSFGLHATFHAAYVWLLLAVVLKLVGSPFLFFVPAFVSIAGVSTPLQSALIAFAGPGTNLLLYLISKIFIKSSSKKALPYWLLFSKINLFFFIFNMLPIPGFDGFTVYLNLFRMLF